MESELTPKCGTVATALLPTTTTTALAPSHTLPTTHRDAR